MSEVALIGDVETGLAFRTIGVHVVTPETDDEVPGLISRLAQEGYRIVLVTEAVAEKFADDIMKILDKTDVSILSIPAMSGSTGYGIELVRKMSIRALGADVLFADGGG